MTMPWSGEAEATLRTWEHHYNTERFSWPCGARPRPSSARPSSRRSGPISARRWPWSIDQQTGSLLDPGDYTTPARTRTVKKRHRKAPAGCGGGRTSCRPRRRQVEHVAPGPGQASSSSWRHTRRSSLGRLRINYTASIFDAIWSAGKVRRERWTHLALYLEAHDVTWHARLAAEEGVALQNGERTSIDRDRTWDD